MARIRYSLADAEEEAKRLAIDYVQNTAKWPGAVFKCVGTSRLSRHSSSSKHPVEWVVFFELPWPEGVVVDGGDLMFDVNIETKEVRQFDVG